jgi:ubiquinone/menaquinone biosynthesis C-methylase UbiE
MPEMRKTPASNCAREGSSIISTAAKNVKLIGICMECQSRSTSTLSGECSASQVYSTKSQVGAKLYVDGFKVKNVMGSGDLMCDEKVSREWNEASKSWADFVRTGKDYYREEMNNPATLRIIGNVENKQLLDLSCGEGYNTRILAKRGAKVIGVDFSEEMIELARQSEKRDRLGIKYYVSDAADLEELEDECFDVVTCFMALMDIERYEDAISEVARVLKRKGRFVFSITHPCFEYGDTVNGEQIAEWKYEQGGEDEGEKRATHLEVRKYFGYTKCEVSWDMRRLVKPFKTTAFHRTLTDYFQALHRSGFMVSRLVEPKPTSKGVSKHPSLRKHTLIPHSIVIEATKK